MGEQKEFYYIRVSAKDQNEARQLDALKSHNIEISERDIFMDKKSGKNFERPQYQLLKNILRQKDVLYIKTIDRLGRNYQEIVNEWMEITKKIKADIVVLDMPLLDTRKQKDLLGSFVSDLALQILSYVAQQELEFNQQRRSEGIKSARARGIKFGRNKIEMNDNKFRELYPKWKNGDITARDFMEKINVKPNTFYRRIAEFEALNITSAEPKKQIIRRNEK